MTDHTMTPFRHARRGSTRSWGMLVAVGVGLAAVGLVGYVVLMRPRPEEAPRVPRPAGVPKDLEALAKAGAKAGDPLGGVGSAEGVRIELADKKDPTRVAAVLLAKSVRPLEGRRAAVTEPGALISLRNGQTLRVTARSGLFSSFSADQAPERGTFEGNVRVMVYGPLPTPATRATDWEKLTPIASADLGDRLEFDLPFGQVLIPGAFTVRSEGVTLTGEEAKVVLDDAGTAVRSVAIARDIEAVIRRAAEQGGGGGGGENAAAAPAAGSESRFRIDIASAMEVSSGDGATGRTLHAEMAEAFLRLIDNKLKPGALARLESQARGLETSPIDPDEAEPARGLEEIRLSTAGPLDVRTVAETPPELAQNDVFLRLKGGAGAPVTYADTASTQATAQAPLVEYGATRGDVTLIGEAPATVQLEGGRKDRIEAQWLTLNVPTRVGQARGPGGVHQPGKPPEEGAAAPDRRVEWGEQADFRLDARRQGWELAWTRLAGDVTGSDGKGTFAAQDLTADFLPGAQLSRVVMSGGAGARDGKGAAINAETLDLVLTPREDGKTDPSLLTAAGIVEARDARRVLSAGLLESTIIRDERGVLTAKDVVAKEFVNFGGDDRVAATAPELHADVPAKKVELIGEDSTITQGPSQIFGALIKLDGAAGTLKVESPGRFETSSMAADGAGFRSARASWATSMSFDDATGVLEALGRVKAESQPDESTVDRLIAEKVRVTTAREGKDKGAEDSPFASAYGGDRRVVSMTAESPEGRPAVTAESRRYDGEVTLDSVEGRRLERVLYLEGRTVTAGVEGGTLSVPGAGKALVLDRRAQADAGKADLASAAPAPGGLPAAASSFRGTALFEWKDAMDFARGDGTLTLQGGVKVTNDRPADKTTVFVQADTVKALLAGLEGDSPRAELSRAEAAGGVFARFKTGQSERELTADHAVYDALRNELRIDAKAGGEVSLLDVSTATPVRAAELLWDLAKDRVEVVRPSPITTPR